MQKQFRLTDNIQELQLKDIRVPFPRELGMETQEFVTQANELLNKHKIEFPNNFSATVPTERITLKSGIKHPVSIEDFEKRGSRTNHIRKLPPFFINCVRLENEFNQDSSRFLKELIGKPCKEGLLHNGSLLVVALSYAERGYQFDLWPSGRSGSKPDLLIEGIESDVKYMSEADFIDRILKQGQNNINWINHGLRTRQEWSVGNDVCFNIGRFISDRYREGIRQADMLFADFSEKDLRDLRKGKHSKPESLAAPRIGRVVLFSWSIYRNSIETAYFIDFSKRLLNEIRTNKKRYQAGADFLHIKPSHI